MSDVKVGELVRSANEQRDAIHVAVFPIQAECELRPGDRVCINDAGLASPVGGKCVGIVDPFLISNVRRGDRFWLFLFPGTVNGMRHHWGHPLFPRDGAPNDKLESERWLRSAAKRLGVRYDELIAEYSPLATGDYINNGEDIRDVWCEIAKDYWYHRKVVTGVEIDESNRGGFTCSC